MPLSRLYTHLGQGTWPGGEGQHQADHPTWAGLRVLLQCLFLKWTPIVEQLLEVGRR